MATCQGPSHQGAHAAAQLPRLTFVENIETRFSGNLCPPCRHRFQRSVSTVRPGSVQFPSRFGAADNQDEVLELIAAFSIPLSGDSAP